MGLAGGAGGVDQRGQLVGTDSVDAVHDRRRRLGKQLLAALFEFIQGDHPGAIADAVDDNDLVDGGQFGAVGDEFVDLGLILRDDDPAPGVRNDEGHVLSVGGRVHGGGGGAGRQDGEVDNDPLVPGT